MREKISNFLHENGLIPQKSWKSITLQHQKPTNQREISTIRNFIKENVGQGKKGVYLYENADGQVLYIGIGNLVERIYSHYLESFKQVSGDRTGKWFRFFSSHQGQVKVYWMEVENREDQLLIESILTYYFKPLFLGFEKKRK